MKINVSYLIWGRELTFRSFEMCKDNFFVECHSKDQVENGWIHHLHYMYNEIWHLWKTYSFLFLRFLIRKSTGVSGSRWSLLIRLHTTFKINLFPLVSINLRVESFYRINDIMGGFFCRNISSIYLKPFWDDCMIIPRIYNCEAFVEPFKFINKLWILNKFSITISSNMLNPEKFSSFARTLFLIGIIL